MEGMTWPLDHVEISKRKERSANTQDDQPHYIKIIMLTDLSLIFTNKKLITDTQEEEPAIETKESSPIETP